MSNNAMPLLTSAHGKTLHKMFKPFPCLKVSGGSCGTASATCCFMDMFKGLPAVLQAHFRGESWVPWANPDSILHCLVSCHQSIHSGSMSNFCPGWSTYWNNFINHLFLVFKHSQIKAAIKFNIHSFYFLAKAITFLDSLAYFSLPLPPRAVSSILGNDFSQ